MIPLRDVIPSRTIPLVTMGLIGVNAAVFLYQLSLPPSSLDAFIATYAVVPAALTGTSLLTSMYLHGGWLHLVGNMLYLWIFGDNVEDRMGHGRFLVFYTLCGVLAALVQIASAPHARVPMVGASGAIAGVLGAYVVLFPRSRVLTLIPLIIVWPLVEIPAVYLLGFWFLVQLMSGLGSQANPAAANAGGVAFWAHVAGFVAGALGLFVFRRPERQRPDWWH